MSNKSKGIEKNQTKSNGRGGSRSGAGRKPGAATKKTREIADKAALEGITPLEFMLNIMRRQPSIELDAKEYLAATVLRFEAAKAAAPYMHAKLASLDIQAEHSGAIQFGWLS